MRCAQGWPGGAEGGAGGAGGTAGPICAAVWIGSLRNLSSQPEISPSRCVAVVRNAVAAATRATICAVLMARR